MNLFRADFHELYQRHLCRHSQFGINVWHLIAVAGVYHALLGIVWSLPGGAWLLGVLLAAYFLLLGRNVPSRPFLLSLLFVGGQVGVFCLLPELPIWVHACSLFLWHRFQNWQHRIFDKSFDMSEFAEKYKKGPRLFVVLAVYELPILLNYFVSGRENRMAESGLPSQPRLGRATNVNQAPVGSAT